MLTRKTISVVTIAYRDEGNIIELYDRLSKEFKKITPNYEIIYVNDASPDSAQIILEKLAVKDKHLTVILHSRNFGAQNAFTTGMKQAIGDAVVIMDGDLQDPPEMISKFVQFWLKGYDVVYGVRRKREKSMGRFWELAYHLYYVLVNKLSYIKVPTDAGDFSLMDRRVAQYINDLPEKDRFIRGLRAWVGFKQIGLDYVRPERFSGKSTNNFIRNLFWVRKTVVSFSFAPIEWVFYIAILAVIASMLVAFLYIGMYMFIPGAPRGFLSLLVAVLVMGCVQLVVLSIICEYLRRIFEEVKSRPVSIIQKIINNHQRKS